MAHFEQMELVRVVRAAFPAHFRGVRVLEVGSGEILGSVRALFDDCEYLGVDVAPGPGVDRVCPGQDLDAPSRHFDTVISCECFEHNPWWRETFVNMLRMLRPGGLFVMTCALTGRQEHGTRRMDPGATLADGLHYRDYYRNLSVRDLTGLLDLDLNFSCWTVHANPYRKDLYFVGIRAGGAAAPEAGRFNRLADSIRGIRLEKPPSPARRLTAHADYAVKRGLVALLGEAGFHDAKFRARQGGRRLLEWIVGADRVARYREERRRRKGRRRR